MRAAKGSIASGWQIPGARLALAELFPSGSMLEILAIVVGVFDLAGLGLAALKYWRISCGLLVAASAMVVICFVASSSAARWIVGFHVFVMIVAVAIIWEQKRGRLKD